MDPFAYLSNCQATLMLHSSFCFSVSFEINLCYRILEDETAVYFGS